ncbi:MAG TPA: hypothetical protein VF247_02670, partial [Candidatus Krumholzibacteria bacterium]
YKNTQHRRVWFTAQAGPPALPHYRMLAGYARAVRDADVPLLDKMACFAMLLPWMQRNAATMWKEMTYAMSYAMSPRRHPAPADGDTGLKEAPETR